MEPGLSVKASLIQSLLEGPGYGQLLVERVRTRSGGRIQLREGSLYPTLGALEREGLLRSWVVRAPGARGRPRRYYELTPAGIVAARQQRQVLAAFIQDRAAPAPSRAERQRMAERLRRCSELSGFLLDLRDKAKGAAPK